MYEEIKRLAVEAVRLQNKLNMEAALNEIVMICDRHRCANGCSGASGDDLIAAGDVLVSADGEQFKVDAVLSFDDALSAIRAMAEPREEVINKPSSFGMPHIKKEGAAIHPDDVDADMTDAQYSRQLAAYIDSALAKSMETNSCQGSPSPVIGKSSKTRAKVAK